MRSIKSKRWFEWKWMIDASVLSTMRRCTSEGGLSWIVLLHFYRRRRLFCIGNERKGRIEEWMQPETCNFRRVPPPANEVWISLCCLEDFLFHSVVDMSPAFPIPEEDSFCFRCQSSISFFFSPWCIIRYFPKNRSSIGKRKNLYIYIKIFHTFFNKSIGPKRNVWTSLI